MGNLFCENTIHPFYRLRDCFQTSKATPIWDAVTMLYWRFWPEMKLKQKAKKESSSNIFEAATKGACHDAFLGFYWAVTFSLPAPINSHYTYKSC
ncbi:uncharacterized protein LOC144207146 isoform X2 [Stigmatopora nigra]